MYNFSITVIYLMNNESFFCLSLIAKIIYVNQKQKRYRLINIIVSIFIVTKDLANTKQHNLFVTF